MNNVEIGAEVYQAAEFMLKVDGDRDHMNRSDLTVEQSIAIGLRLRQLAHKLGFSEAV